MDYDYPINDDKFLSPSKSNQRYSISNSNFYICKTPYEFFDRDYEELSKLFSQEYKDISLHRTDILSKELKSNRGKGIYSILNETNNEKNKELFCLNEKEDIFSKNYFQENYENKERKYDIIIDKIYNESLSLNEKDNIFSKLFFHEKKENNDKFEEIVNQKNKESINLNKKGNYFSEKKFETKIEKNEKKDEILTEKIDKESSYINEKINEKENTLSKSILEEKNDKNKKKSDIIIDKKYIELIHSKIKTNILSKRPFKEKKVLGRKRKENEGLGEHNKFSDDNIIRKIKHVILDNVMKFTNKKIHILYSYENEKVLRERELFKLKQNPRISSRTNYNKKFLDKKLVEIFSNDISSKYSRFPTNHNKKLIESMINGKDEKKKIVFNKIFNLTFVECLNHFRGSKKIDELEGVSNLDNYLKSKKMKLNEEYSNLFIYFVNNYEKVIMEKKSRIRVKK